MTVMSRDVGRSFQRRPSLTPSESFSGSIISLKLVLARNGYSLVHYIFVHSPPGLRTAARNDTLQDGASTTVRALSVFFISLIMGPL